MPVIVVGADTPNGREIVAALVQPWREVRAFVSDPATAEELRGQGVKVALGDVSDGSHVGAACTNCHTVVLIVEAASDGRERSFAPTADAVLDGWAEAVGDAGVARVIWVGDTDRAVRSVRSVESATVTPDDPDLVATVVALDDAATL